MAYRIQKYRLSYVKESGVPLFDRAVIQKTDVEEFARKQLAPMAVEAVLVIALDNQNRITGYTKVEGTVNQCVVYPREVFSFLFSCGACSFILSHNHPAGSTRMSEADWMITERLHTAGKSLDIPLQDHVLITETEALSLRNEARWPR